VVLNARGGTSADTGSPRGREAGDDAYAALTVFEGRELRGADVSAGRGLDVSAGTPPVPQARTYPPRR